ncbi:MAG: hypothetical protein KGH57_03715 [Candidatus Micrarchaeota archaeon]|nr:hypothetical protein [Candidatus Micrarchaeota archaeon]
MLRFVTHSERAFLKIRGGVIWIAVSEVNQIARSRGSVNPILLDGIERCAEKVVSGMPSVHIEGARRKLLDARSNEGAEWGKKQPGVLRENLEEIAGTSFDHMGPQHTDFEYPPIRK